MMRADIQIENGERQDTRDAFGLTYLSSDKLLAAPVRAYEATSYAEQAGENIDPRTTEEAFDFKITFCTESIDPRVSMRRTSTLIKKINDALFSRTQGGDIMTARKVTIYDYPRNRVIVGYPKPITEPEDDQYFISRSQEFAVVSLNLRVTNPNECDFDWEESISNSVEWYGIEYDTVVSSPICTRIGNMNLHRSLPIQSRMRGCLLDDDGNVVKYLNPLDWTDEPLDGSQGQVMVEIPAHYRRFETDGTKRRVKVSEYPLPGFHYVARHYISAFEASLQRSTHKLASVVNTNEDYRGGNNTAAWDNTYRSLLGRPATALSRTTFRTYARNRKAGSTEWNCMTYDAQKAIYWLFVVEYATLNTQAAFNPELTTEGYRQGGLGAGVTNLTSGKWNTFNGYYPFIPCGLTDTLGNNTGVVEFTMPDEYDPDATSPVTTNVPRYRGIENPFGHIWQWTDGINVRISPTEANGGDGLSKVFVCSDPAQFKDNGYDGYSHVGNEARNEGYVKEIIGGEYGEIMPSVCSGAGSTTYFCDYHYTNIPTTETLRGVLFGGASRDGAAAGLAYASSPYAPSGTSADVGSRLCFIPKS